ncbi:MAG: hypothetical protein WCF04_06485 [Candidatus Nanopelagicales bacterium]
MAAPTPAKKSTSGFRMTPKAITAIVIAAVSFIFVFSNAGEVTLSWAWLEITAPGWVMLLLLLGAGMAVGFFLGRNRYRKK